MAGLTALRDAARSHTLKAIEVLASIMADEEAQPTARVGAIKELLDRGYGKAVPILEAGAGSGPVMLAVVVQNAQGELVDVTPQVEMLERPKNGSAS